MTIAIQLDLPLVPMSEEEVTAKGLQEQITKNKESMGKIQRKLFKQMGEQDTRILYINSQIEELRKLIDEISGKKIQWAYLENECLFLKKG